MSFNPIERLAGKAWREGVVDVADLRIDKVDDLGVDAELARRLIAALDVRQRRLVRSMMRPRTPPPDD